MSTVTTDENKYCESLTEYRRFRTREVKIGNRFIGGSNPILIQSMTTTDTMDTEATVKQSIRMIEAGCELVRITAPSKKDAENLRHIKAELRSRGYETPLVADIHFTPNAAELAAAIVEKVRVNPGNYADKKKFETLEYTDETYQTELDRIRARFAPLVEICKAEGTAMRIGTNHGSLSDRIMSRYGDTPRGMVESAMEFLNICRDLDFHDIVLSMKASNTHVMVEAYRLLVHEMMQKGMNYPLHLGVTEAGEGEDGRIKSAVGIGTLLEDGLGDTIRVSLTEDPEFEIPIAKMLAERYEKRSQADAGIELAPIEHNPLKPFEYSKRHTAEVGNIGGKQVPVVIGDLSHKTEIKPATLFGFGYSYSVGLDKWNLADQAVDFIYLGENSIDFALPGTLSAIADLEIWQQQRYKPQLYPLLNAQEFLKQGEVCDTLNFIALTYADLNSELLQALKQTSRSVVVLSATSSRRVAEMRRFFIELINEGCDIPVVLRNVYHISEEERLQLYAATDAGALFIDGLGDGIWIAAAEKPTRFINSLAFGILQASRTRISKTEYISCPSCGRTLFDLQETTAKIRARTNHLKGVKIGIMGCIVNGPGEMADADYGYVGTGPGKITLYKEKTVVKKNVDARYAVEELIELIKEHGDWIEPTAAENS